MKGLFFAFILIFSLQLFAKTEPRLTDGFWKNTKESFTTKAPYHLAAIGLTPLLIASGADAKVHTAFQGNDNEYFAPGDAAGYLGPFVLGVPLYTVGKLQHDNETLGAAYTVAQTSVITLSTVSILKAITGRREPDTSSERSAQRQSRDFKFGFLNRGIYEGWPSGHMATITSLATAMTYYYPYKTWVKWVGYGSMAYIMLTISAHNEGQFHWFSDGVAGGLIGYAIGKTVGTNMRASVMGTDVPEEKVSILPILGPQKSGIQLVWFQ